MIWACAEHAPSIVWSAVREIASNARSDGTSIQQETAVILQICPQIVYSPIRERVRSAKQVISSDSALAIPASDAISALYNFYAKLLAKTELSHLTMLAWFLLPFTRNGLNYLFLFCWLYWLYDSDYPLYIYLKLTIKLKGKNEFSGQ